jgi:hypothetical protein
MTSVLPNQILSESTPLLAPDGKRMAHNWWLWCYNISEQVLGNSNATTAAFAAQTNADLDADVDSTDSLSLVRRVSALEKQASDAPLPDFINTTALMLAQDPILPDAIAQAGAVQVLTPSGSPWTFQSLFNGTLLISGGTVSGLTLSRDGVNFYAVGFTSGAVPMSRLDQVLVTYSGTPAATFFPR